MTENEQSIYSGRAKRGSTFSSGLVLRQFRFRSDYVLSDAQFRLKAPLGKIESKPSFGTLSVLNAENGTFQLYSQNGLWDLTSVSESQKKLVLDLLRRKFVCVAEILTFHDNTEADDVRGVVRLSLAFFLQGFRQPQGLEIKLPQKILGELEAKRHSVKFDDIAKNFMFQSGDGEADCFAYVRGYRPEEDDALNKSVSTDITVEQEPALEETGPDASTRVQPTDESEKLKDSEETSEYKVRTSLQNDTSKAGIAETGYYRLFGKKYDFDVVIAGPEGEEYLIVRRPIFKQKERPVLSLARAKITFSENPSPVAAMLKETLTETAEYAKTWDRYSNKSGDFLLKKACKIGVLRLDALSNLEGGKRIVHIHQEQRAADNDLTIHDPFSLLEKDDELIAVDKVPEYIAQQMTWEQYRTWKNEKELREKEQAKPEPIKILNVNKLDRTLTLNTQHDVSGTYVWSLKGEETIIKRRTDARDLLITGQTPNPVIAQIITHDLKEGSTVTAVKPQRPKGLREALSGRVAQKIFSQNPPTAIQRRAIEIALNTPDIAIIQGPPGTGKTTVITAILERLNELSNKDRTIKGRVLITSLQHDAVKNVIERLRINSLPTIKFGGKEGDNDVEGSVSKWCADIVKKLKEKNPQFKESSELEALTNLYQLYCVAPSDENARIFLESAKEATNDLSCLRRIENILDELRPAEIGANNEVLRMVRRLRSKNAFFDDGRKNAHSLYDYLNDEKVMDLRNKENAAMLSTLKEAAMCDDQAPSPELLERLKILKKQLLEQLIPRPAYRASEAREDISELYREIRTELRRPLTGPDDEINNVVFEFMRELETNPLDVGTAVQSYGYAYAATALQSNGKEIRKIKELRKSDKLAEYDTVIVDEAARVNPCDLMIPLAQAKERIILVGDHRQLPHMYEEDVFQALQEEGEEIDEGDIQSSMFEHLVNKARELMRRDGIPRFITLDAQYRMHPLLGQFASDEFYAPYQEAFYSPLTADKFQQPLCDKPLIWIDVPYRKNSPCVRVGTSWRRDSEAEEIVSRIAKFMEQEKNSGLEKQLTYGVISFYSAQVKAIQARLSSVLAEENAKRVLVGSVDAFQGREFDVIFLSTVRTGEKPVFKDPVNAPKLLRHEGKFLDDEQGRRDKETLNKIGRSNYGFLTSPNRLCVALTRQKKLLIVVGDSNIFAGPKFCDVAEKCVPAMKHLYQLCLEGKGEIIRV